MKKVSIEWRHYDKEGETCTRCNNTGDNIKSAIKTISNSPELKGVQIDYIETKLEADRMPESNSVLINNLPLEKILNATTSENHCHSCSCLAGESTNCRTIELKDKIYEVIPEELVIDAIKKLLT